jgi:hypothetical protein
MQRQIALLLSGLLSVGVPIYGQEPTTGGATQQNLPPADAAKPESTSHGKKNKSIPAFVILGTVFNENVLSYPNVRVQVRRENEKKFEWDTYTNSRGEFAVRVPEGQEYEVVVREKQYKDVSLKIIANNGDVQQRLSIRLEKIDSQKGNAKK